MDLKSNKILFFIIKLTVSSILLYLVLSKAGTKEVFSLLKTINPLAFIISAFLYLIAQFFSTIRWKLLLSERVNIKKLFSLYMIGAFFNIILPGIIGGDAVKGYYLYKETGKGTSTLASIFMDRYIGFICLLFIGMLALPFGYNQLNNSKATLLLPIFVLIFTISSLFVFSFRIGKRFRFLTNFYNYFHHYRTQWKILLKTFLLSIIIQSLNILAVYIITLGINQKVSLLSYLIFMPLIIVFTTIPISISGIGVREGVFTLFLGSINIKADVATAISLLWFLSMVAGSLPGFIEYIRYKK